MKHVLMILMAIAIAACGPDATNGANGSNGADGQTGAMGTTGATGATGVQGPPGPSFRYADANGNSPFIGGTIVYEDASGVLWQYDGETAKPLENSVSQWRYYSAANCMGTEYLYPLSPRYAHQTSAGVWKYRPKTTQSTVVSIASVSTGGNCSNSPQQTRVISESQLLPATPPNLNLTPPLHLEKVP